MKVFSVKSLLTLFITLTVIFVSDMTYSQTTGESPAQGVNTNSVSLEAALAFIYIFGFAIQQFIEAIDPLIATWITKRVQQISEKLGGSENKTEADFKKTGIFFLSFVIALIICAGNGINILTWLPDPKFEVQSYLGYVITAFVLGSGTESVNIAQKYLGYIKESKKTK